MADTIQQNVMALNTTDSLHGGGYTPEQRLNALEKLLSMGLVALSVSRDAIREMDARLAALEQTGE